MTIKDAIERIKEHARVHLRKEPNAVHITEALQMACNSLEKQMPKKVEKSYSYLDGQLVNYLCANCGNAQGFKVNKRWQQFCPHCGQALDWSDT